jgi:hypothetical protein
MVQGGVEHVCSKSGISVFATKWPFFIECPKSFIFVVSTGTAPRAAQRMKAIMKDFVMHVGTSSAQDLGTSSSANLKILEFFATLVPEHFWRTKMWPRVRERVVYEYLSSIH